MQSCDHSVSRAHEILSGGRRGCQKNVDVSGLELHSISSFTSRRCTVFRFYCQLLLAYASAFRILNVFIRVFSSGGSDDGPPLEMLAEKSVRGVSFVCFI